MAQEHRIAPELADRHLGVTIVDRPDQFDHRGMVLRAVCDLEALLAQLLLASTRSVSDKLVEATARKELFSENGLLGSLSKSVRFARHLGLLTDDEVHDLRILARLRNGYAHGRHRDQFHRDSTSSSDIRALRLYLESKDLLANHDEQGIFLACVEHLALGLVCRAAALAAKHDSQHVVAPDLREPALQAATSG